MEDNETPKGILIVVGLLIFGLAWMFTHPDEVNRVEQQKSKYHINR